MGRARLLLAATALLPALACFAPSYGSGHLACDPESRCPEGFDCLTGRCWRHGEAPPPADAAPADSAVLEDRPVLPMAEAGSDEPPDIDMAEPEDVPSPDVAEAAGPPDMAVSLLASLSVTPGKLDQDFQPETHLYSLKLPLTTEAVRVRATPARPSVQMYLLGTQLLPNTDSTAIALTPDVTKIVIQAVEPPLEASYTIYAQRGGISTYIKKPLKATAGDHFGRSVALSADTLVVGAPEEATGAGTVYVFVRGGGSWRQQGVLKPATAAVGTKFGASVALHDDTIVVGAPGDSSSNADPAKPDTAATGAGAVYVFTRTDGTWTQQAYLKPLVVNAGDAFGSSVTAGEDTLAVGAPLESGSTTGVNGDAKKKGALHSGAVYVFTHGPTNWTQQAYIKASITKSENQFGASIALSGETLVAGAPRQEGGSKGVIAGSGAPPAGAPAADNSGAAYVFVRNAGAWTQQAWFKPSNTAAGFFFGSAVDIAGDVIAVGAPGEHSASKGVMGDQRQSTTISASGAVYLFQRMAPATWMQTFYVKASNTAKDDQFGQSLALSSSTLAVAAPNEDSAAIGVGGSQTDNTAKDSGAVYVFGLLPAKQLAYLKAVNCRAGDSFGDSVAVAGATIAVGAPNQNGDGWGVDGSQSTTGATASGAVYVY